jgi:hypothetical protein
MRIRSKIVAWTGILLVCQLAWGDQGQMQARDIVDRSFKVTKLAGIEMMSTMTIIDGRGRERVRELASVSKLYDDGATEKRLIRFLAPADVKGTGLLTFDYEDKDDDMWLFMPALRKTRRIVSTEKAKNFMGSEFTYADMTPPVLDDFTYTLLGEKEQGGIDCWEIEVIPANEDVADENGFSKRVVCIEKQDFVLRHASYYDLDGELQKELEVLEIQEVDTTLHRFRPTHMVMTNLQNERKSVLKVDKIAFSPDVKDEFFTTRYLERY